ncbi:MAG: porin [Rikenellaceae bacterium]
MKFSTKIFALAAAITLTLSATAQETTEGFYNPQIFGTVMTTFNASTYNGYARFNVRNSRFGIKGNASRDFSYYVQVDFSNQGSVSVLDSYLQYKKSNFDVMVGQQRINLSEDMMRGPSSCLFSSRSYAAVSSLAYLVGDTNDFSISNMGSRDIGIYARYSFLKESAIPMMWGVGLFNGNGANNPEWDATLNFTTRLVLGDVKSGFSAGGSFYTGKNQIHEDINVWTGEARYVSKSFMIESTYQQRRIYDNKLDILQVANIQGYYKFFTPNSKMFSYVSPLMRWDIGDNVDYLLLDENGDSTNLCSELDSQRLTFAFNVHFKGEKLRSRMSIGYEKFIMKNNPADIEWNTLMHDKFTMSFIGSF